MASIDKANGAAILFGFPCNPVGEGGMATKAQGIPHLWSGEQASSFGSR
jgi:hypothetical protein